MTDHYDYRMTVNGTQTIVPDTASWNDKAWYMEERAMQATLERRLVTDERMLDFWPDGLPKGWMHFPAKNIVVCAWEVIAQIK
jgi:hypothetical protein